jgi:hypothetical protein
MNAAWHRRRAKRELRAGALDRRHIGFLRLSDLYVLGYTVKFVPKTTCQQSV